MMPKIALKYSPKGKIKGGERGSRKRDKIRLTKC